MEEDHELEASLNPVSKEDVTDQIPELFSSTAVLAAGVTQNLSLHMSFS